MVVLVVFLVQSHTPDKVRKMVSSPPFLILLPLLPHSSLIFPSPSSFIVCSYELIPLVAVFFVFSVFTCVGALAIVGRLDCVDIDLLGWWLAERQVKEGGLNGRPEKLPDVCMRFSFLCVVTTLGIHH